MIHSDIRTYDKIPTLFKSVDRLADEIKHKAKTIHYRPPITQEVYSTVKAVVGSPQSSNRLRIIILLIISTVVVALTVIFTNVFLAGI